MPAEESVLKQIVEISDEQIGKNYLDTSQINSFLDTNSGTLFTAIYDSETETVSCEDVSSVSSTEKVVGFIKGHSTTKEQFKQDRFNSELENIPSNENLFEVTTWAVAEDFQGYGVGLQLIKKMTSHIRSQSIYPVISPVRKITQNNVDNSAFEFLVSFGSVQEELDEKPAESVVCAKCGTVCSCKTVLLSYTEKQISNLHTQVESLVSP